MKAFKGCVNEKCIGFQKKIHYKDSDYFCSKCGERLCYVCADCWCVLDDNHNKYCIRCENIRKDKRDQRVDKVKQVGAGSVAAVGAVAGGMAAVAKSADTIEKSGKALVDIAKRVVK